MSIKTDFHMHSFFSGDSQAPMEDMIKQAISLGFSHICFTEHLDLDFPVTELDPAGKFEVNVDSYLYELLRCRQKYETQIKIGFGIEMGLQPHLADRHQEYITNYPFDFVIGSSHLCHGKDPYYAPFYENRSEDEAYEEYFVSILENIQAFSGFDVYGHLDYVVRYGPNADKYYSYAKYQDLFDSILKTLIEKGKGIEINTGGLKKGLKDLHPCRDILKRYKELGGEIITIGSDAHDPSRIGADFERAKETLVESGFRYYTIFTNRKAEFFKL